MPAGLCLLLSSVVRAGREQQSPGQEAGLLENGSRTELGATWRGQTGAERAAGDLLSSGKSLLANPQSSLPPPPAFIRVHSLAVSFTEGA